MKRVYVSFVLRIGIVIRYSHYWHTKFHWVSGGSGAGVWAWLDFFSENGKWDASGTRRQRSLSFEPSFVDTWVV